MRGNVARGAGYLTRGAKLLNHPSLRVFVIVPLVINILIFGSLIALGFSYISDLMDSMLASIPGWMSFITWILWPLIIVTVSLIAGYFFTSVALIIASPFNALLAEKAEELITGAWMMSIQFVDYPMDNHQLSFAEVKRAVRSRRLSSLGFGGLVAVCTGIPLVNFFVVPAAVVGATLLWCEELNQ